MSLDNQQELLKKLDSKGLPIPGLDPDKIIENLVKKDPNIGKYLKMIDTAKEEKIERGATKEEAEKSAEEAKKKVIEDIKKNLKPQIIEDITKIKQEYKTVKEAISSMVEDIAAFTVAKAQPSTITVPPGLPNPATVIIEILQKKKDLEKILNIATTSLTTIITIANKLKFELPEPVTSLVSLLSSVQSIISLPIPDNLIPEPEPATGATGG